MPELYELVRRDGRVMEVVGYTEDHVQVACPGATLGETEWWPRCDVEAVGERKVGEREVGE